MNKIAGINHGSDAPDNGRKLMITLSPASLNWLPITLSKAISVTTATVICIPDEGILSQIKGETNISEYV